MPTMLVSLRWTALLVTALATVSASRDISYESCDVKQYIEPGETAYFTSPDYPKNYKRGIKCRWNFYTEEKKKIRLECPEFNVPKSFACTLDRLIVYRSGNENLSDANLHCGQTTIINVDSFRNQLIAVLSTNESKGTGKFKCSVTVL